MAPTIESVESFGSYLKRERELREISLEEIAAYTRIKLRALQAIEGDDFASLPALAFVRAFTRCYADYIGLNVPDVMLRFDTFVQNRYPELTGEVPIIPKKNPPRQRYIPLVFALLAVFLVALYYWLESTQKPKKPEPPSAGQTAPGKAPAGPLPSTSERLGLSPPPTAPAAHAPAVAPSAPHASPGLAGETTDEETGETARPPRRPMTSASSQPLGPPLSLATLAATDGKDNPGPAGPPPPIAHTLTITVDQPCWIKYLIDDDDPRQTILQPDQTVTFAASSLLRISFGKPEAVKTIIYNGKRFNMGPICFPFWITIPPDPNDRPCQPSNGG